MTPERIKMEHLKRQRAIADGLFTWPSHQPRLIGSKCQQCGEVKFPRQNSCSKCCSQDVQDILLEQRGILWTWTIQAFPPKSPPYAAGNEGEPFVPFGIGYVELPGQVRVESRLTVNDPSLLRIGMPMELVIESLYTDGQGEEVLTFAFRPVEDCVFQENSK